jgi:hypothetical protein
MKSLISAAHGPLISVVVGAGGVDDVAGAGVDVKNQFRQKFTEKT